MPALAPQEETEIVTRHVAPRDARPVSSRVRGAQTRGVQARDAQRKRAAGGARVLAPSKVQEESVPGNQVVVTVRKRRAHRELNVSLTVVFFTLLIFAQACMLLLFKGMAVSATHRAEKLGDAMSGEIGRVNDEIALTQKQIASLGSPAQVKRWADAKGWKMASPQSFDDIRQTSPPNNNDPTLADNGTQR